MYAHQIALGTETERIIEWLQPQALKRCLNVTYTTFCYVVFALKQNRTILVIPFVSKLTVKPGSTRVVLAEYTTEYPVTDLLIFKTRLQMLQDISWYLHPVPSLTHLLKQQHWMLLQQQHRGCFCRAHTSDWEVMSVSAPRCQLRLNASCVWKMPLKGHMLLCKRFNQSHLSESLL